MLRLPDGMRDRIKAVADANNRSMNAEIVATLEDRYPSPFSPEETQKMIPAAIFMFGEGRMKAAGLPPETTTQVKDLMKRVLRAELGDEDPEGTLARIEARGFSDLEVSMTRFMEWFETMQTRHG